MLKVSIIGCGKIADSHVLQIQRIEGCQIISVCDKEILMAKQLAERYRISQYYDDLEVLLNEERPDVVHITTPPQSHFDIGRRCLEAGCHAYIEKPFTVSTDEAEKLVALSTRTNRKLTVGTDEQFSFVARRMRKLVKEGYLGGPPVHIESVWCYEIDGTYARAFSADKKHWVRALPGGLLQNTISHGIAKISEFLSTESPRVIARGFVSPHLDKLGVNDIIDELRVIISEDHGITAYFTFSSQMRPVLHQFRIYGPRNGLILDEDQQTLISLRGKKFKSYADKFIPPLIFAGQYISNFAKNLRLFLARDFHMDSGKKYLIKEFYRSIINNTREPIPYREIILTSRIMDKIFAQVNVNIDVTMEIEADKNAIL